MKKKVIVGMSGGVDSSVACQILKEQGYSVIGVTMLCSSFSSAEDAQKVAQSLNIPHHVIDFSNQFKDKVIDYFISEYLSGKTPNPCVVCNKFVKWESLLKAAEDLSANFVATGHYAKIINHPQTNRLCLKRTDTKDQTYVLYGLSQKQLSRTLMPIGDYSKHEVRKIAAQIGLEVADKPDSQEICFVPDKDYAGYIKENYKMNIAEGDFLDINGKPIGRHKGIIHYTIGQRKGLGISFGKHMYVKAIDAKSNTVTLGDDSDLFSDTLTAKDFNFMALETLDTPIRCLAKIRYAHNATECTASIIDGFLHCKFDKVQRAITPGQAVVLYEDDMVLGGGIIC